MCDSGVETLLLEHERARPAPAPASDSGQGLELSPLRGVRLAAPPTRDLGPQTAPPDAHQDPEAVRRMRERSAHHVIRLVPHGRAGLDEAAGRLRRWLARGVLTTDPVPGLYLYEQRQGDRVLQRGLIGALGIRAEEQRVVLPHEDVFAGPVADRLALTRSAAANLEPLYCLYEGGTTTARVVAQTARTAPLLALATAEDGITHSLRHLTDADTLARVAADLRERQVLVADGHHRYAAYQALRRERRLAGLGPGPGDHGLALLVDVNAYAVPLTPVHRIVAGCAVGEALTAVRRLAAVQRLTGGPEDAQRVLAEAGRTRDAYLFCGAGEHHLVTRPRAGVPLAALHHVLLPAVLGGRPGTPDGGVRPFRGTPRQAVAEAARAGGTAVVVPPVELAEVFACARAGRRMPHKSTAFGLKPRTGLVMRVFAAPDTAADAHAAADAESVEDRSRGLGQPHTNHSGTRQE